MNAIKKDLGMRVYDPGMRVYPSRANIWVCEGSGVGGGRVQLQPQRRHHLEDGGEVGVSFG